MGDIDFQKREFYKRLPPEQAVEAYLLSIPPERQVLVLAMWDLLSEITNGVVSESFTFNKDRLLTLVDVMTDDIPELIHLAPEESMPLEMKEMFRSWISGFEHMLPGARVRSPVHKDQLMVATLLGGFMKAGLWVSRGVKWLEISEGKKDPVEA